MTPTCSKPALHLLASILLAGHIADAVALPHQVLDPRTPLVAHEEAAQLLDQVQGALEDAPDSVYDDIGETLKSHSMWEGFRDLIAKFFGGGDDGEGA